MSDDRRRVAGRRIKRARRAAGYRSAKAFGAAIGFDETTVYNAERGSERVGPGAFQAIELGLGWPDGCIEAYLSSGDETKLPSTTGVPQVELRDDTERMIWRMVELPEDDRRTLIQQHRHDSAAGSETISASSAMPAARLDLTPGSPAWLADLESRLPADLFRQIRDTLSASREADDVAESEPVHGSC